MTTFSLTKHNIIIEVSPHYYGRMPPTPINVEGTVHSIKTYCTESTNMARRGDFLELIAGSTHYDAHFKVSWSNGIKTWLNAGQGVIRRSDLGNYNSIWGDTAIKVNTLPLLKSAPPNKAPTPSPKPSLSLQHTTTTAFHKKNKKLKTLIAKEGKGVSTLRDMNKEFIINASKKHEFIHFDPKIWKIKFHDT